MKKIKKPKKKQGVKVPPPQPKPPCGFGILNVEGIVIKGTGALVDGGE